MMINKFNELFEVKDNDTLTTAFTKGLLEGYIKSTIISAACVGAVAIGMTVLGNKIESDKEEELEDELEEDEKEELHWRARHEQLMKDLNILPTN